MIKKLCFAFVLAFVAVVSHGKKSRVIDTPEWLSSDCGKALVVTGVEFTDTATILSFHSEYTPNRWIRIASTSKLIGDDGATYSLVRGYGITPDEQFYMPESGHADFKVAFEPMPMSTRYIDFIEGPGRWRIWGIHESGEKMWKVRHKAGTGMKSADESAFFRRGTGVVRGRFTGKKPKVLQYSGYRTLTQEEIPQVFDVADDGAFTATISVENPILDYFSDDRNIYYFYVGAGDTLDITIGNDGLVDYPEQSEYAGLMRLMSNENPGIGINFYAAKAKADSLSLYEYGRWIDGEMDRLLHLADYIADRRGLTAAETHLFKTNVLLSCGMSFFYPGHENMRESMETANYGVMRRMPEGDLSCLSLPVNLHFFINRYEFCNPIYLCLPTQDAPSPDCGAASSADNAAVSDSVAERYIIGNDTTAMAADKAIMGKDTPSMFLQLVWLNKKNYVFDYALNPDEVLQSIKSRRSLMTSERMKDMLDEIERQLKEPKVAVYELPAGKASDVFNAIVEKYRGKYVYIDFWGIYCGPCRAGIESSQQLRDTLAGRDDIELVYITSDVESPKDKYDAYVAEHLKGEESYRLPHEDYLRLRALFGFNGIPHHELVAPDGRIIDSEIDIRGSFTKDLDGFMSDHLMRTKVLE